MNIIADTHTHTIASSHAYSTLSENAKHASDIGLKVLCHTEHAPSTPNGTNESYFRNLVKLPRYIYDVLVVRGVELSLYDEKANLDLPDKLIKQLEWVIASLHPNSFIQTGVTDYTKTYMNLASNPLVNCIGHCGNPNYPFELETVIKSFAEHNKVVEINSSSFKSKARLGSYENCKKIAELCAKHEVNIVVSSDAHFWASVGEFTDGLSLLKEIDFPEHLVLNADYNRFMGKIHEINGGKLVGE